MGRRSDHTRSLKPTEPESGMFRIVERYTTCDMHALKPFPRHTVCITRNGFRILFLLRLPAFGLETQLDGVHRLPRATGPQDSHAMKNMRFSFVRRVSGESEATCMFCIIILHMTYFTKRQCQCQINQVRA